MRIVVTGANRGIGLALVEHYLAGGHDVHATARDLAAASSLLSLSDRYGTKLALHPLDVRDDVSCRALRDALLGASINLLVNNAGIGRDAPDDPAQILAVKAVHRQCRSVARILRGRDGYFDDRCDGTPDASNRSAMLDAC